MMNVNISQKIINFTESTEDYPVLVGFLTGFYPLVFVYSNNFSSLDSWQHIVFFSIVFLIFPIVGTFGMYTILDASVKFSKFKKHLLYIVIIQMTAIFFCQIYLLTLPKKILLGLFILVLLSAAKFHFHYKKIIIFLGLLSILPMIKLTAVLFDKYSNDSTAWTQLPDDVTDIKFKKKPNIYLIQPDGYAGREVMGKEPYGFDNPFYGWLESEGFKVYDHTVSNYPASLMSNASMFAMKHHYIRRIESSPFEMQQSRKIITGNNPVLDVLKNNGYQTFFIVEDEYFQKNFSTGKYDYYNIDNAEIPFFSNNNSVKKNVFNDLRDCSANENSEHPRFFFVEKLLPHHVHFDGTGKANERRVYLRRIKEVNRWLKNTIALIEKNDQSALIIVSSDHGGWVGIESLQEMFTTKDKTLVKSIFSNLLAIKWNNPDFSAYDQKLKSNVNLFRVVFACLSEDQKLLEFLEKDDSYRIVKDGMFGRKAEKAEF